jgi:uncharacterized protein (TIGR02996 family)
MSAEEVEEARVRGDGPRALHAALAVWRDTRDATVGDVIRGLDAELAFDGPSVRSRERFHQAWLQIASAGEVESIGWLARTVAEKLPKRGDSGDYSDLGMRSRMAPFDERVAVLGRLLPDPRIADGVLLALATGAGGVPVLYVYELRALFDGALALVARNADARTVALCADVVARPRAKTEAVRAYLAEALPGIEAPKAQVPADLDHWRRLVPGPDTPDASAVALLEQIRSSPDDLALRAVYADVLQEQGDARGTFIALQLERRRSSDRRADRLFREHGRDWLGPDLSRVLVNVRFRNGFLHEASLAPNHSAGEEGWQRAKGDPRLRTLVRLAKGRGNRQHYGDFVTSPFATALADVEVPFSGTLERLLDCPHPRTIRVLRMHRLPNRPLLRRMAKSAHLTALRTVVLGSPGARGADRFVEEAVRGLQRAGFSVTRLGIEAVPDVASPRGVLGRPDGLGDLGLTHLEVGRPGERVTLVRSDDARVSLHAFGNGVAHVEALVASVGAPVSGVTIYGASVALALSGTPVSRVPDDDLKPQHRGASASGLLDG